MTYIYKFIFGLYPDSLFSHLPNNGNVSIFKDTKDAHNKTGLSWGAIRQACSGHRKTGCGYIWKFKNQPLVLSEHVKFS